MLTISTLLKLFALLAVIVLPLIGSKRRKNTGVDAVSNIVINNEGYLEYAGSNHSNKHPVQ